MFIISDTNGGVLPSRRIHVAVLVAVNGITTTAHAVWTIGAQVSISRCFVSYITVGARIFGYLQNRVPDRVLKRVGYPDTRSEH